MTMYDPECDGIYDEVYDPREEDDVYPPFITSVLCHNPKCDRTDELREVTVYHPSEEFFCAGCGQRMW